MQLLASFFFVALGLCLWDAYRRNAECSQTAVTGNAGEAIPNQKPLQNSSLYKNLLMPVKKRVRSVPTKKKCGYKK